MFKSTNSLKYEAECVKSLVDFCTRIIEKHKYPDTDTRTAALVNVRFVGYSSLAIANLLDSWSKGDETVRQVVIPSLIGLTDVNEKSVKLMGDSLHKSSKLSLILIGQFQIENCISNITKALEITSKNTFYSKAKALIDFVEFGNNELDVLKNGSMIRNSLHSNGIHNGYKGTDSHNILKYGVHYDFYNGEKVSCASLPHIAHALECSLEVLYGIISSSKVKSYTGLIEDVYLNFGNYILIN